MKLQEAVNKGKEKGITDVKKCVDNIVFNTDKYFNFLSQNIEEELVELIKEEIQYKTGKLKIKQ